MTEKLNYGVEHGEIRKVFFVDVPKDVVVRAQLQGALHPDSYAPGIEVEATASASRFYFRTQKLKNAIAAKRTSGIVAIARTMFEIDEFSSVEEKDPNIRLRVAPFRVPGAAGLIAAARVRWPVVDGFGRGNDTNLSLLAHDAMAQANTDLRTQKDLGAYEGVVGARVSRQHGVTLITDGSAERAVRTHPQTFRAGQEFFTVKSERVYDPADLVIVALGAIAIAKP